MRNMSFALTTRQIKTRTKTVTRRLGWWFVKPGDLLRACVKCQGLKPGEKIEPLAALRVVSVRRERLWECTDEDAAREGFPELSGAEFVAMFRRAMGCDAGAIVNRIEFEYVEASVLDVLKIARGLIAKPNRWTTGEYARDANGNPCEPTSTVATCWCAEGAIAAAVDDDDAQNLARSRVYDAAKSTFERLKPGQWGLHALNDDPDKGHDVVVSWFDEAIARLEASVWFDNRMTADVQKIVHKIAR